MGVEIYYFSGTGNTLYLAKKIAKQTNAKLIPIASIINEKTIKNNADAIGIVFPVYFDDVPVIIKKFAEKLENLKDKYIFLVCNYGGSGISALKILGEIIKSHGGKISAEYGIHMPQNSFPKPENYKTIFIKADKKLEKITKEINSRKKNISFLNSFLKLIFIPLHKLLANITQKGLAKLANESPDLDIEKLIYLTDKAFIVTNKCISCGTCAKICPVNNIKMVKGKPEWQHHCECCLACYNYCPVHAIEKGITKKGYFYQNPNINLSELINQKKKK